MNLVKIYLVLMMVEFMIIIVLLVVRILNNNNNKEKMQFNYEDGDIYFMIEISMNGSF